MFVILLGFLPWMSRGLHAQSDPAQPEKTTLTGGIQRFAGEEQTSHIKYVKLVLAGSSRSSTAASSTPPTLIAQCTLRPNGRSYFELFTSFDGVTDFTYYPPWTPVSKDDLFPPHTDKVNITMEFLGYTKVKPVRRQWEVPMHLPGLFRYDPPGSGSTNLEEVSYYLRYLVSLPTLRLTLDNNSTEFLTTPLLAEIRREPLCRAAAI
jgi:hypothetical protein